MRAQFAGYLAVCLLALGSGAAVADPASESSGRYTMTPVDGGFMRLDKETGAVALCTKKDATWACESVKDGTGITSDAAKIEAENKALKERIKALEDTKTASPPSADAYPTEPPGGSVSQLPTEEEVDKAFDYIEGMYKKLRDRIKKFEEPTDAKPDGAPKTGDGTSGAL
ncbi:MAG TPA: hypothetical protein PLD46_00775 [Hyphomicrobium sp.]|nr:hypothetical protein [Hyphomicrobium sp.]